MERTYYTNGVLASEVPVLHGEWHGAWKIYYPNGRIKSHIEYQHNKPWGKIQTWEKNGYTGGYLIFHWGTGIVSTCF